LGDWRGGVEVVLELIKLILLIAFSDFGEFLEDFERLVHWPDFNFCISIFRGKLVYFYFL
jgi:hypothetical protein